MNNQDMWIQLVERHVEWSDPEHVAKLRVKGIKALIDQAFECGFQVGNSRRERHTMNADFKDLFGKKFKW
jgi:hypothetical protein